MSALLEFWDLWSKGSAGRIVAFYSSRSTAYRVESTRLEPETLVARARAREYFHSASTLEVEVGNIEITILGDRAAIATYFLTFQAQQRAKPNARGVSSQEDSQNVRATHVCEIDSDDQLRIVHEHFSLPIAT